MPAYVPMLEVTYYAQNYAGIIRQCLPLAPHLLINTLPTSTCQMRIPTGKERTARVQANICFVGKDTMQEAKRALLGNLTLSQLKQLRCALQIHAQHVKQST